ncbi:MAG: AAA family ATPase [Treponema sp.]
MKPKTLQLTNIGPFKDTHTIQFDNLGSIFLICGKTGAGKTTIFDALAYTFYGKPLGGRAGITKHLRSQFAAEDAEAQVVLSFYLGTALYRITRKLAYTKKGNKTETPEEVLLEEFENSAWVSRSLAHKTETEQRIRNLIKLSEKEFSRIVLLPQGEFAQFLRANSAEKKTTLINLFPVTHYTALMQAAKSRADMLRQEVNAVEKSLAALATQFNSAIFESQYAQIQRDSDTLRNYRDTVFSELKTKNTELEQEKVLIEKRREYEMVCEELAACKEREEDMHTLTVKIEQAQQAAPLAVQVMQLQDLEHRRDETKRTIADTENRIKEAAATLNSLEQQKELIAQKELLKEQLTAGAAALEKAVVLEQELLRERKAEDTLRHAVQDTEENAQAAESRLQIVTEHIAVLQNEIDHLEDHQICYQHYQDILAAERKLVELLRKKNTVSGFLKNYTITKQKAENALYTIQQDMDIRTENIQQLEQEKHTAQQQQTAAVLAKTLETGMPCPVCGAVHHPNPAQPQQVSLFSFDERIAAEKRSVQSLQKQKENEQRTLAAAEESLHNYQLHDEENKAAWTALQTQHIDLCGSTFPDESEAAARVLAETARQTEDVSRKFTAGRKALQTKKSLELEQQQLRQVHTAALQEKTACEIQLSAVSSAAAEKQKQFDHAYTLLPKAVPHGQDTKSALESCRSMLLEIKDTITSFYSDLAEADKMRERLNGELSSAQLHYEEQCSHCTQQRIQLEQQLCEAGFDGLAELTESLCSESDIAQWKEEIKQFETQLITYQQAAAALEKELQHTIPKNLDELLKTVEILEKNYNETEERLDLLHAEKLQLEQLNRQYTELNRQLCSKSAAAQAAVELSNDLNGSNSRKLQFDTWILSRFLHEVTLFANKRLERMSEGQYRLIVSGEKGGGNTYKGLDLEIADAQTGQVRPSASLSGGETFMASISLALGLADSIQARTGGIHIDSMFIDEGFGSLDEKALENAISILDEIRGNRMVGIISHVGELQTRIPQKIEVVKTGSGSYIRQDDRPIPDYFNQIPIRI